MRKDLVTLIITDMKLIPLIENTLFKNKVDEYFKSTEFRKLVTEISNTVSLGKGMVDDGPDSFRASAEHHHQFTKRYADKYGYKILRIATDDIINKNIKTDTNSVSDFLTVIKGKGKFEKPVSREELINWKQKKKNMITKLGYSFINFMNK